MNKAWSKDKDHKEDEECEPCQALKIFKSSRPFLQAQNKAKETREVKESNANTTTTNSNTPIPANTTNNTSNIQTNNVNITHQDPPDLLELGRSTWTLLHSVAAYYPDKPTEAKKESVNNFIHDVAKVFIFLVFFLLIY